VQYTYQNGTIFSRMDLLDIPWFAIENENVLEIGDGNLQI
jgi:hypothetical protein